LPFFGGIASSRRLLHCVIIRSITTRPKTPADHERAAPADPGCERDHGGRRHGGAEMPREGVDAEGAPDPPGLIEEFRIA
jgi:hypothetical protein